MIDAPDRVRHGRAVETRARRAGAQHAAARVFAGGRDVESVGGPLMAGMLIALFEVRYAFWFDGVTYLVSALQVRQSCVPRIAPPSAPFPWSQLWKQVTYRAGCS